MLDVITAAAVLLVVLLIVVETLYRRAQAELEDLLQLQPVPPPGDQ